MFKLSFFLSLLGIDQLVKWFTHLYIPKMTLFDLSYPFGGIGVFHHLLGGVSFSLNYVENKGAAWGLFSEYATLLFWVRVVAIAFLFFYTFFRVESKPKRWAFFSIITGAVGNICDTLFYGHVVDLFHFNFWGYTFPVFNLADCLISIGVGALFFSSWSKTKKWEKSNA